MRITSETGETEVRGRRIREQHSPGLGEERQRTGEKTRKRPPRTTTTSPSAQAGEDLNALIEILRTRKKECEKGTRPFITEDKLIPTPTPKTCTTGRSEKIASVLQIAKCSKPLCFLHFAICTTDVTCLGLVSSYTPPR